MNKDNTISVQDVRKNPLAFLRKLKKGQTLTVIYHSKPLVSVMSAETQQTSKSTTRLLEYAEQARGSTQTTLDKAKSYKELYSEDMAKKYGVS